jgi:parallel beta-helix repeat protein
MKVLKFCALLMIAFLIQFYTFSVIASEDVQFINYVITSDGTIEPDNSVIIRDGNNYFLTQDISGSVVIQKNDAVFDGAGYTLRGNAVIGSYNLSDSVLYLEAGLNLTKAWNVTVQNLSITNCVNGVSLVNAYFCKIINCTIFENAVVGMKLAYSANNSIVWNKFISNSDDAIQLIDAQSNNIMVNNLHSGVAYRSNGNGFQLNGNCSDNVIEGNTVASFDTGIFFDSSSGNMTFNVVSYNTFTDNKWNGAFVTGSANNVTLNNFYGNGLLIEGDSNCSGNYWNTTPPVSDSSPLDSPVNIDVTPVFLEIPQNEPAPTNTPVANPSANPTVHPKNTASPTPTSKPTETEQPIIPSTPTSTPRSDQTQPPINPLILLVITVILAVVLVSVPLVHKGKTKGLDKAL